MSDAPTPTPSTAPTPEQIEAAEAALRQLDSDEDNWPTGEQVEAIITAVTPSVFYTVAWTGGYDEPSYEGTTSEAKAIEIAQKLSVHCDSAEGDRLEIIITTIDANGRVTTSKSDWRPEPIEDAEDENLEEDEDDSKD